MCTQDGYPLNKKVLFAAACAACIFLASFKRGGKRGENSLGDELSPLVGCVDGDADGIVVADGD